MIASALRCPPNGESIYSILARYADHGPVASLRTITSEVFGFTSVSVSTDLPRHLGRLADILSVELGLTAERLIAEHTMFPLYAPFLTADRRSSTVRAMTGGGHPHFAAGIAASGLTSARTLRFCPRCFAQDVESYGQPIWRCCPQAAGVLVCYLHAQPLYRSNVSPYANHANPSLVHAASIEGTKETIEESDYPKLESIARDTAWLLSMNRNLPGPDRLHGLYYQKLRELGYLRADGSVRVFDLSQNLRDHFGPALLKRLSTEVDPTQRANWVERLARRPRNTQAPLRHLLLIHFLGLDAKTAMELGSAATAVAPRASPKPHEHRIRNTATLVRLRTLKRQQWNALMATPRPGSLRTQNDNLYSWLWRNDRDWLLKNRPSRVFQSATRINWSDWDVILSHRIANAGLQLISQKQPFVRLSWNRLASASGKAAWLARPNEKLPDSCRTIANHSETPEQFALRKIKVVTQELPLKDYASWRVRVAAGISVRLAARPAVRAALSQLSERLPIAQPTPPP